MNYTDKVIYYLALSILFHGSIILSDYDDYALNNKTAKLGHIQPAQSRGVPDLAVKRLRMVYAKEIANLTKEQKSFSCSVWDLNADGYDEILIGLRSSYFCGSGGCTALLLNNNGVLIARFTVAEYPFLISRDKTMGWHDLLIKNGRKYKRMKFNGKSYPSNASLQESVDIHKSDIIGSFFNWEARIYNF